MNQQKKKGLMKRMLSLVLGLTMLMSFVNGLSSSASSGTDLTSDTEYSLEKFMVQKYNEQEYKHLVKNGKAVSPLPDVFVTDTARVAYKFNIDRQVNPGDYFILTLPDKNIFKSSNQINKPLMNGAEQM